MLTRSAFNYERAVRFAPSVCGTGKWLSVKSHSVLDTWLTGTNVGQLMWDHCNRCTKGWVDEESNGNPFSNLFGGGKKKKSEEKEVEAKAPPAEEPKKNGFWPF